MSPTDYFVSQYYANGANSLPDICSPNPTELGLKTSPLNLMALDSNRIQEPFPNSEEQELSLTNGFWTIEERGEWRDERVGGGELVNTSKVHAWKLECEKKSTN